MGSLLVPPLRNNTSLRAIEQLTTRLLKQNVSSVVVMDIDNLPTDAFLHMAEQLSVLDEPAWQLAPNNDAKRGLLKRAFELHRYKGTVYAIKLVFEMLDLGDVTIEEGRGAISYNGAHPFDGYYLHGSQKHWAVYRVLCSVLLTAAQAAVAKRMLSTVAPARDVLYEINFTSAKLIYNSFVRYDGSYNYGAYL